MKELSEMTFDELVQYCQGKITLAIPVDDFRHAVWDAMDLALRWRVEQDKQLKTNIKGT